MENEDGGHHHEVSIHYDIPDQGGLWHQNGELTVHIR